jgi:Protein kinase domain
MKSLEKSSPEQILRDSFRSLWEEPSGRFPDVFSFLRDHSDATVEARACTILVDQYYRWHRGIEPRSVEFYLEHCPALGDHPRIKLDLVVGEYRHSQEVGSRPSLEGYVKRFPDLDAQRMADEIEQLLPALLSTHATSLSTGARAVEAAAQEAPDSVPTSLGRYRVMEQLGSGGFGAVYRGYDLQLKRDVAIKVPRRRTEPDAAAFLTEAQYLAQLDHPGIVPVHDVGRTADGLCYIVSKLVSGGSLQERMGKTPFPYVDADPLPKN